MKKSILEEQDSERKKKRNSEKTFKRFKTAGSYSDKPVYSLKEKV